MQLDSIGSSVLSTVQRTALGGAAQSRLNVDPVEPASPIQRGGQEPATVATSQTTAFAAPLSADAVTALQQGDEPANNGRPPFGQGQTPEDGAQSLFRTPANEDGRPGEPPQNGQAPVGPPPPNAGQRPPPAEQEGDGEQVAADAEEQTEESEEAARQDEEGSDGLTAEEEAQVRALQQRDAEVRRHEQAHAAAGGQFAGSPSYEYERGPDGRLYAIGGEVSIDTTPISGDPQATIAKAQQVRRAALAPSNPSPQDQRVAAQAQQQIAQARADLRTEQADQRAAEAEARREAAEVDEAARSSGAEGGDAAEGVELQVEIGVRQTAETADPAAIASRTALASPPPVEVASRSLQSSQAFADTRNLGAEQPRGGSFY